MPTANPAATLTTLGPGSCTWRDFGTYKYTQSLATRP